MSTLNMCAPPQTYSRLFRPWDTKIENGSLSLQAAKSHHHPISLLKTEYCATETMNSENIDIMNLESAEHSNSDSDDNDCSSSNSSGDSTINPIFDDCESDAPSIHTPPLPTPPMSRADGQLSSSSFSSAQYFQSALNGSPIKHGQHHLVQTSTPHFHQPITMFSGLPSPPQTSSAASNNFYYAAAAAAVAANGLSIPTISPNFGIEAYPMGLMEHEYARVIAEEAHLKALNARKQRPKKFKCPHCDVAFSNNGQLKGHIRIHTGERPFKCDAAGCGKSFTRNEELTRHKRIHTGLRPFPCPACGKKFGRRDHLKKHMKTHMPQEHPLNSSAAFYMPMYPYMYGL